MSSRDHELMTSCFLDARTSRNVEIWNSVPAEVLDSWLLDLLEPLSLNLYCPLSERSNASVSETLHTRPDANHCHTDANHCHRALIAEKTPPKPLYSLPKL